MTTRNDIGRSCEKSLHALLYKYRLRLSLIHLQAQVSVRLSDPKIIDEAPENAVDKDVFSNTKEREIKRTTVRQLPAYDSHNEKRRKKPSKPTSELVSPSSQPIQPSRSTHPHEPTDRNPRSPNIPKRKGGLKALPPCPRKRSSKTPIRCLFLYEHLMSLVVYAEYASLFKP